MASYLDDIKDLPQSQGGSYLDDLKDLSTPEKSIDYEKEREIYSPTKGQSRLSLVEAGAGKAVEDLLRGGQQLGAESLNRISSRLISDDYVKSLRKKSDEIAKQDRPLMESSAGTAGYVGGNLASTMIPIGMVSKAALIPQTLKGAAALGAAQGALNPVGESDSRAVNAVLGSAAGMAGQGISNILGKIASPTSAAISSGLKKATDTLEDHGISLSAAQKSGDEFLKKVASSFSDNPYTAGAQAEFSDAQQKAFNRAVLSKMGEDSDKVTPEVMQSAKTRIGKIFDDVAERNPVIYDMNLHKDLHDIHAAASTELTDDQMGVISRQISNIVQKAEAGSKEGDPEMKIDGKAYQNIKQSLDRLTNSNDGSIKYWAGEIKDAMEEALGNSTIKNGNPEDFKLLKGARTQWGNMRKIEGAIDKNLGEDISPSRLMGSLSVKRNRPSLIYGSGDQGLNDLARAGNTILPDKHPNSGTAARIAMHEYLNPVKQAAWLSTKLGQSIINRPSTAEYITQGVQSEPIRRILESPQDSVLISNLLKSAPAAYAARANMSKSSQ